MLAAHQGVEVKELPGVGMGEKLPKPSASAAMASADQPKTLEIKPGPPPVLTRRGAEILVQVEKMLDDLARVANKSASGDPSKPAKAAPSSALAFPENYASATDGAAAPASGKN
jgi:penicillin-binding protein 1A